MERAPKKTGSNSSSWRARGRGSCWRGAVPREEGEKKITIAQREVLRRKVEKIEDEPHNPNANPNPSVLGVLGRWDWALGLNAFIALGVTGGIGAYKAVEVCRGLQKQGHDVVAVMTRSAARFVGPVTFEAITRRPVITSQWKPGMNADIEHVAIADSHRPAAGRAVHGQRHRQVRQRHRRRLPAARSTWRRARPCCWRRR